MNRPLGAMLLVSVATLAAAAACSSSGSSGTGGTAGTGATEGGVGGGGGGFLDSGTGGGGTAGTGATGTGATGGGNVGSCQGLCGTADPAPGSSPECYCDSQCEGFGDCCSDYATLCGGGGTGGTGGGSGAGVCRKYCCAASDCGANEVCQPIDATNVGTLGGCVPAGAADAGTDSGTAPDSGAAGAGGASDGGSPEGSAGTGGSGGTAGGDAGAITLPAGCVLPAVTLNCNPLTNAGCTGSGQACDMGFGQSVSTTCYDPPNNTPAGQACDNSTGPFCIPGHRCLEAP